MKIEIEDLWRIAPPLNKSLTVLTFIGCLAAAPYLRTPEETSPKNMNILVAKDGVNMGIKSLDYLDIGNTEIINKKGIYSNENGICFANELSPTSVQIRCPMNNSLGAINKISEYEIQNKKISNYKYFYEPVISAKIAIMLFFWFFLFATPIYFWTLKKADLSQLRERAGKRKIFNFKKD